jgi:dTDP-4-amino-4,6-dideoxygalactose transaminase
MVDLARQHQALLAELQVRLQACFAAGRFIGGPEVEGLEGELAARLGVRHAIGVNSGTDALLLALRAAGVGHGDEVITSPVTFVATAGAIHHAGARPVFADIDPLSFTLSPDSVEQALTPRTRALLPVHLFGQAADMAALLDIARRHDLVVIEDCAQSLGATLDGVATGGFGLAGAFSFYPTKNLGACGDGGMVVCNDDQLAAHVRRLANHGSGGPHRYLEPGFNSRLDALQAVVLRLKLQHIDAWNARRRAIAGRYHELLRDLPLQLPAILPGQVHAFHHYTVLVERRDEVAAAMRRRGVDTALYYPVPLHRQPAFAAAVQAALPVAEDFCRRCLSLPMFAELEDREVEAVAAALAAALKA